MEFQEFGCVIVSGDPGVATDGDACGIRWGARNALEVVRIPAELIHHSVKIEDEWVFMIRNLLAGWIC